MLDAESFSALLGDASGAARKRRESGFAALTAAAMPSSDEEIWRYLDLDFTVAGFSPAPPGAPPLEQGPVLAALGDIAGTATVVDGRTVAVTGGGPARLEEAPPQRGPFTTDHDIFTAAAAAYGESEVRLTVPRGVVAEEPYAVDVQAPSPGFSAPHIAVDVEDNAEASLVIVMRSPAEVEALVAPQITATVGAGSRLRLSTVQLWGYGTRAIAHQRMSAADGAVVRFGEIGIGGRLSRLHLVADLAGTGAEVEISGTYFGEETQTLDYRYFMNHAAPRTRSDMFLKGALEDEATSVFTGLIRIEPEGQKTEAFQTNRNLVLSAGALANSVPNLEILADDVRCGHGSTVGPLDEEQRYYLQSRGLDRLRADRLQVRGFFEEALARLPHREVAGVARDRLNQKFIAAQEAGRL